MLFKVVISNYFFSTPSQEATERRNMKKALNLEWLVLQAIETREQTPHFREQTPHFILMEKSRNSISMDCPRSQIRAGAGAGLESNVLGTKSTVVYPME